MGDNKKNNATKTWLLFLLVFATAPVFAAIAFVVVAITFDFGQGEFAMASAGFAAFAAAFIVGIVTLLAGTAWVFRRSR